MTNVHCPECGFQNPEVANYCSRCGALLIRDEPANTTMSFTPDDATEDEALSLAELRIEGPALVVRAGGGRSGETFALDHDQVSIGRGPECEIFLDDVTVSRKHAVVHRREDAFVIEDLGSLNGTFLNKRRIESGELTDDDELQIGKYRLTFLAQ
jgi:pSer/pThr/pTyr-binding forkhead associated (FHA) protein